MPLEIFDNEHMIGHFDVGAFNDVSEKAVARGVGRAARWLRDVYKAMVGLPGPKEKFAVRNKQLGEYQAGERRIGVRRTAKEIAAYAAQGIGIRPSAPGEPPRKRTGNLQASIKAEQDNRAGTEWLVGTNVNYGYELEWGNARVKPRPWLRPGLMYGAGQITDIIVDEVKREVS